MKLIVLILCLSVAFVACEPLESVQMDNETPEVEIPEGQHSVETEEVKRHLGPHHHGHWLHCYSKTSRGNYATCRVGYTATGCACGHRCGSWHIIGSRKCYCHIGCMNRNRPLDWTLARCCKVYGIIHRGDAPEDETAKLNVWEWD